MSKPWTHTSPSQIATFKDCKRKWWRVSVNGERQPPTPSAQRGSRIHEEIEDYIINGTEPIDGTSKAIINRLNLEPGKTDAKNVEIGFQFTPPGWPIPIKGRIDLYQPDLGIITDHKTTSSLNYAKNEYELKDDIQAITYSAIAFKELGVEDSITFRLAYGTTKPPMKTEIVRTTFTKDEIELKLSEFSSIAHEQFSLSHRNTWQDIEPNYQSCDKYGRCNFLTDCRRQNINPLTETDLKEGPGKMTNDFFKGMMKHIQSQKQFEQEPEGHVEQEHKGQVEQEPEGQVEQFPQAENWFEPKEQPKSQYASFNPPDGLPDGEPLPEEHEPKKRASVIRWNGKGVNSLKKQEALDALFEIKATLGENALSLYEQHAPPGKTLSVIKEQIKTALKIKNGQISLVDEPEQPKDETPLFSDLLKYNATSSQKDNLEEGSPESNTQPEQPKEKEGSPESNTPPEQPKEEKKNLKMLLIDAHTTGAIEADIVLYPLIQEIEAKQNAFIGSLQYAQGYVMLSNSLQKKNFFAEHDIIRIDSTHPGFRHIQQVIINQADLVIRSTK